MNSSVKNIIIVFFLSLFVHSIFPDQFYIFLLLVNTLWPSNSLQFSTNSGWLLVRFSFHMISLFRYWKRLLSWVRLSFFSVIPISCQLFSFILILILFYSISIILLWIPLQFQFVIKKYYETSILKLDSFHIISFMCFIFC